MPSIRPAALLLSLFSGALLASPQALRAQSCDFDLSRTPATGVPQVLWGEIEPVDTGTLPPERDSTDFSEFKQTYPSARLWMDVDIEAGWMFTAYTHGLQIWDVGGAKAANPSLVSTATSTRFLTFTSNPHEFEPVTRVDAPPGDANVLAVATVAGINVFDTSNKFTTPAVYADSGQSVRDVFAGRVNGRNYAVAANTASVTLYDLSAAVSRGGTCVDKTPTTVKCGVYLGRIGQAPAAKYVHGVGDDSGTRLWVAFGGAAAGVEVLDISTPLSPVSVIQDDLGGKYLAGVALFRSGGGYYLAVRISGRPQSEARIYDVSCIATGSCGGALGPPIWALSLSSDLNVGQLSASQSNGRPFLYYSSYLLCPGGLQEEWLFDVSDPSAPRDITPPPAIVGGTLTGYWGYYYRYNPTGFNHVNPRAGQFYGDHFYRAAYAILDIHTLTTPTPAVSSFTWSPDPPYAGQQVSFTDTSTGRPTPTSWSWSLGGGSPATSSAQNPPVIFATPGPKSVSLTASNGVEPLDTENRIVQVLDPSPVVNGISVSPASPLQCQPVTLDTVGATGLPPLTIDWEVRTSGGSTVHGGTGARLIWQTEGAAPGNYIAAVEVDNAYGPPATAEAPFTLGTLPPLPLSGSFEPTHSSPIEGTTRFSVDASGATEFCWDFGDGTQYPAGCLSYSNRWSRDPINGPAPGHTYSGLGTYWVTVQVRNCQDTTPRTSTVHEVEILSTEPLAAMFEATGGVCWSGAGCFVEAGRTITFADLTTGAPSLYEYDWDGDGNFEQSSTTPVTEHAFGSAGIFTPVLQVQRGSEVNTYTHIPSPFYVTDLFDDNFESGNLSKWSSTKP